MLYNLPQIAEFIRSKEWEGLDTFSVNDIKKCNVDTITQVYNNYLLEFGYSNQMLMADEDNLLDQVDSPEMHKESIFELVMYSILSWTFQQLGTEKAFALRDVSRPDPLRTQFFFGELQNFSCFISNFSHKEYEVLKEVKEKVTYKEELLSKIKLLNIKKEKLKNEKAMRKAEEDVMEEKVQKLKGEIRRTHNDQQECNKILEEIIPDIEQLELQQQQNLLRISQVEKSNKCRDGLHQLDQELKQKTNSLQESQLKLSQFTSGMDSMETTLILYKKLVDQAKAIKVECDKGSKLQNEQEILTEERQQVVKQLEDNSKLAMELEKKIALSRTNIDKLKMQMSRRKEGKQKELADLTEQEDMDKNSAGEANVHLAEEWRRLQDELAKYNCLAKSDEYALRQNYARINCGLETFNDIMNKKFDQLNL